MKLFIEAGAPPRTIDPGGGKWTFQYKMWLRGLPFQAGLVMLDRASLYEQSWAAIMTYSDVA